MQELRANTQVIVKIGPFPDVGDGFTPQTDIDITASNEAELFKHNTAATVDISARTWAAVTDVRGWYNLTLTTTDTNTEGCLDVVVQDDSDCLPVVRSFMVLSMAAWDSKYAPKDTGFMDVNIKTVGRADAQETEANNLESACANYSVTRGLTGTAVPAVAGGAAGGLVLGSAANNLAVDAAGKVAVPDTQKVDVDTIKTSSQSATDLKDFADTGYDPATHKVQGVVLTDTCTTNTDMRGTDSAALASVLGAAVGASISADIAAVKAETALVVEDTNELQTNQGNWLTATGFMPDTEDGSSFTSLPAVTLANGAHGGAAAAITLADYSDFQGASGLTAEQVRTEIDSNSTQLAAIVEDTGTTIPGLIAALNDIAVANILAGVIEGTTTLKQAIQAILSFAAGKASGGGTAALAFRDQADTKDRLAMTVDENGNRTAVTPTYD